MTCDDLYSIFEQFFLKRINTFIQHIGIKLIKSDIHNVTKISVK